MAKDIILRIEESIKKNWDRDALTDYKGCTLQYKDVARRIEKLHIMFREVGIVPCCADLWCCACAHPS